jgi:hypothetical protein
MNGIEIFNISVASLALIISVITYITSSKNASAMVELSINERITTTKEKVSEMSMIMTPLLAKASLTPVEEKMIELYTKQFNLSIENNINAYEEACSKYIDGKVDKKRFKKLYKTEIRKLVEHKDLSNYFDALRSEFKAILKVYNEWENLEK